MASAQAQTYPCRVETFVDHARHGPGFARNLLLERVETPFVVFLDADDWILPDFALKARQAITPTSYVYTDWRRGDTVYKAPDCAWTQGTWHCVTTLLHTAHVRAVRGFDDSLSSMEDTDFYLKLVTGFICGIRVPEPLFHFSVSGGRSQRAHDDGSIEAMRAKMDERYGGRMSCCGAEGVVNLSPIGQKQDGDVVAMALWRGNQFRRGVATGRLYPRMAYPKRTWVDPRDITAKPSDWQAVVEPQPVPEMVAYEAPPVADAGGLTYVASDPEHGIAADPPTEMKPDWAYTPKVHEEDTENGIAQLAQAFMENGPYRPPRATVDAVPGDIAPDFDAVMRLAYNGGMAE